MNPPIGQQGQQIIYKVYKFFEQRKKDRSTLEYQNDINLAKTVSEATGVSNTTVRKIVSKGKSMEVQGETVKFRSPKKNLFPKKRIEIDSFTEGVLRRKVSQYYTIKKVIPTLNKLNADLKEENLLQCSQEYLRQTLQRLGFTYLTTQSKKKLLVERHDIMSLRWRYISDIKKYRNEGRPIIFLDETYVNQNHNIYKCWQSKDERGAMKNIEKGLRLIIVHAAAGNRSGFVSNALLIFKPHPKSGDYHEDYTTNFQKWIEEKLLANIPPKSVVVMDNAAYHDTQIDNKPSMSSLKIEMQEWLERRNIPFDSSLRKCDLMKVINEQNVEKQYMIDEIIKANQHTVLRLPPYHSDLNPIEFVWSEIKGELAKITIDSTFQEKKEVLETLFSTYTLKKWSKCDNLIITNEDEYLTSDSIFDGEFDRLVISLNKDNDDEPENEQESEEEHESGMDWNDDVDLL